jgi:hypothetical protein
MCENKGAPTAFVLMPFEDDFDAVHDGLLRPALEEVGYAVKRADSVIDQRSVLSDIVLGIDEASLIVADLTGLNPNVFYELGIAHGTGIPTVLITQSIDELPFDLRSYRVQEYSTRFDEAQRLMEFLREVGREAVNGGVEFSSPVSDFLPGGAAKKRLAAARESVREPASSNKSEELAEPEEAGNEEIETEKGTLDLLHHFIGAQERATTTLDEIGTETEAVGTKLQGHTVRMQEAVSGGKPGAVATVHRIATDVAADMNEYGEALKERVPALEDASKEMIENGLGWLNRIAESGEGNTEETRNFRLGMAGLYMATAETKETMRDYRRTIAETKGVTSPLDKAADKVVGMIGRMVTTIEKTQSFASRAADMAQEKTGAGPLHTVLEPQVECFADEAATERQSFDAVLLASFDRGVSEIALPHEGEPLAKHAAVEWRVDKSRRFPETWIRHPFSEEITLGWEDAALFVGEQISEPGSSEPALS